MGGIRTLVHRAGQLGLDGDDGAGEFGGAETDYVSYALALMELAAADGGLSTVVGSIPYRSSPPC